MNSSYFPRRQLCAQRLALPFVLGAILSACSTSRPQTLSIVGENGGTVALVDGEGRGARIEIPRGALARDTEFGIAVSTGAADLPIALRVAGSRFTLTPEGQTFAIPVVVTLPTLEEPTALYTRPSTGGDWTRVDGATWDAATQTITASVSHFSDFVPVTLAEPPSDAGTPDAGPHDASTVDAAPENSCTPTRTCPEGELACISGCCAGEFAVHEIADSTLLGASPRLKAAYADSSGYLHILAAGPEWSAPTFYAYQDATGWHKDWLPDGFDFVQGFAAGTSGDVFVLAASGALAVRDASGTWNIDTSLETSAALAALDILTPVAMPRCDGVLMAIGDDDVVHVALNCADYSEGLDETYRWAVVYARREHDAWTFETVRSGVPANIDTGYGRWSPEGIALDAAGEPRLQYRFAYPDDTQHGDVLYARRIAGTWSEETIATGYLMNGASNLAFGAHGGPFAFFPTSELDDARIRAACREDGDWRLESAVIEPFMLDIANDPGSDGIAAGADLGGNAVLAFAGPYPDTSIRIAVRRESSWHTLPLRDLGHDIVRDQLYSTMSSNGTPMFVYLAGEILYTVVFE